MNRSLDEATLTEVLELIRRGASLKELGPKMGFGTSRTLERRITAMGARDAVRQAIADRYKASRISGCGTYTNYSAGRCRCDRCRAANTERARHDRSRRRGEAAPAHGLSGYNNWNCRCDICKEAKRIANAHYAAIRREATP